MKKEITQYIKAELYYKKKDNDPGYDKFNKIFYIAMNDIDVDKFKEYKLTNGLAGSPTNFFKQIEIAPQSKPGFFEYRDYWESLAPEDQLNYYNIYHLNASGKCDIIVDPYTFAKKHKDFVNDITNILEYQITIDFNNDTVIKNTLIIKTVKIKNVARKKKSCEERHEDEKENYEIIRKALASQIGRIIINKERRPLENPVEVDCSERIYKKAASGGGRFTKKHKTKNKKTKRRQTRY